MMLSGEPMKETIDSLSKKGKMIFFAGATEKQIHEFELMHDIVLPSQYREWLKFSDGGDLFCRPVFSYTELLISPSLM